jgi:hypothetical protein
VVTLDDTNSIATIVKTLIQDGDDLWASHLPLDALGVIANETIIREGVGKLVNEREFGGSHIFKLIVIIQTINNNLIFYLYYTGSGNGRTTTPSLFAT